MILFFAWTDMQLINFLNTKCNFYKNENADLLVYKRDRVSGRLLEILRSKKIFSEIYIIELPGFYKENEVKKLDRIQYISIHMKLKKYFISKMKGMIKEKKYEKLLVAAFWCETLNVYKYLRKSNKNISIGMIEEGMANYNAPKSWVFRTAPSTIVKSVIRGVFYCRSLGIMAKRNVDIFYLYNPELSWMLQKIKRIKLPVINEEINKICYDIIDEMQKDIDISVYEQIKYLFIVDFDKVENNILSDFIKEMPFETRSNSIIKLHPLYNTGAEEKLEIKEDGIWIDSRKIPIEIILFHCDINDKVLILNHSSALLHLKCMLNKEPYVIFMYKIREYSDMKLVKKFDFFLEGLRKVYSNSEKLMVPESLEEVNEVMMNLNIKLLK